MDDLPVLADQMRVRASRSLKVPLPPGRSQLDWLRQKGRMPAPRPRPISHAELARHRSRDDMWICIRGQVYNVTPYIEFHPGGIPMISKGAGKDATSLFDKYHPWVNIQFMLDKCFVGYLSDTKADTPVE